MAAVGQLAAGIAHDFNNILAGIVLYAQISQRMPGLPQQLPERLKSIEEQAHHGAELVQQILDFGRRALLERKSLALAPFLEDLSELLRRTLPETIHLELTCNTEDATIRADPNRVQQALVNLALNARDAMPQGGDLHITLSHVPEEALLNCALCGPITDGQWVEIAVADTGTGIPTDVLPHIFEPFFTTRAPLGHGLGLAQVYGIVSQHNGHIAVETQVGVGTTFQLYWPALPTAEIAHKDLPSAITQGNGETLLVVVDDKTIRAALVDVLTTLAYSVIEAANGQEALTILQEQQDKIALVLSDWGMPDMGGLAFTQEMQARHLKTPIVMFTGHPLSEEAKAAMPSGVVGWVQKPITLEALSTAVARALHKQP
ncbi:MAG: response regulator [Anaerolineae bacterium]|jgi:CheY-like chemotaxis protein|nr:response regulator [Anaerolineae bacterium]